MKHDNDRLAAALEAAKSMKNRDKKTYYFSDRKAASKAIRGYLATLPPRIETKTMRIHADAVTLAKSAWKTSDERITATSDAIRTAAKKRLGI